jgi:hypothetical protein
MHPQTEGNQGLPNGISTAPRPLGAIKGTPRRIEQNTKHTLSTLQLHDHASEVCLRYLSVFSESLLYRFVVALSSLHLCVLLLHCALVCVFYSLPYSRFDYGHLCKE